MDGYPYENTSQFPRALVEGASPDQLAKKHQSTHASNKVPMSNGGLKHRRHEADCKGDFRIVLYSNRKVVTLLTTLTDLDTQEPNRQGCLISLAVIMITVQYLGWANTCWPIVYREFRRYAYIHVCSLHFPGTLSNQTQLRRWPMAHEMNLVLHLQEAGEYKSSTQGTEFEDPYLIFMS